MSDSLDSEATGRDWYQRSQTAPSLPGPVETWVQRLPDILRTIDGSALTSSIPVDENRDVPAQQLLKTLGKSFVKRSGESVKLTPDAQEWLQNPTTHALVGHLHRHVRFFGEVLAQLADAPLSHDSLLECANQRYAMGWNALDQVRRRTNWLRGTGAVELYDGLVRITPKGEAMLTKLALGGPPAAGTYTTKVGDRTGPIGNLLESLRTSGHASRKTAQSLYFPSPDDRGPLDFMATTVEYAIPEIQERILEDLIQSEFQSAPASTRQARASLVAAGLIYRSRMNHWGATEGARQWLESNEPIDLVALVHASVWFVGEILRELADTAKSAGELAKISSLYNRDPLSPQAVSMRLRFLLDADMVEKVSSKDFRLTPAGRGMIEILPIQDRAELAIIQADEGTNQANAAATGPTRAVELADLLVRYSRDGSKHKQVEQLVCEALRSLGFEVQPIGGPGKTDALIRSTAPALPPIAIEVKTASAGPVPPAELRSVKLERHREQVGAVATVAIGPEFHTDTHAEASKDRGFALMHTETLSRLLLLHERYPFSTEEIRKFLDPALTADQRHEAVEISWTARVHQLNALKEVLNKLVAEQRSPYGDGLLEERDVQRDLRNLDPGLVSEAIHLLSSPFLSALSGADRQRFKPTAAIDLVAQRLKAISRWITANNDS
ncbi:hypothetical protein GCM10009530_70760 [Microbispora corallina]|nr:restriction endonuclease [Microbispora corallina]